MYIFHVNECANGKTAMSAMQTSTSRILAIGAVLLTASVTGQEQPAAYEIASGPAVFIDEAHNNLHTKDGRYSPFADLISRDGYVVGGFKEPFSDDTLQDVDVLVISNALQSFQPSAMRLPTASAFSDAEIEAVYRWVNSGGSLLLIADHMPWAGAAEKLAMRFGVFINNGYASTPGGANPLTFNRSDG